MDELNIGDRVQVFLKAEVWKHEGWFEGVVVRIDPYTQHRRFYWVKLDAMPQTASASGVPLISVLNPKNIRKI